MEDSIDVAKILDAGPVRGEIMGMLARANINIMEIADDYIYLEFQFRMDDGRPKWARTVYQRNKRLGFYNEMLDLIDEVRGAREWAESYEL